MNVDLSVTLLHALPGRLRIRLSAPPRAAERFVEAVALHEGLQEVTHNPVTQSVLIRYETGHLTTEEILLRCAIACSMEHGDRPVFVSAEPESEVMTDGAMLAGALIAVASVARWTGAGIANSSLERAAGLGVAAAVLQHAWREAREQGFVHPELLSLGYLLTAFTRGATLRGAALTWAASFGRHLLLEEIKGVQVRPLRQDGASGDLQRYQVALVAKNQQRTPLLGLARAVLRSLGIATGEGSGSALLEDLRDMARVHGEVVEGLDGMKKQEIPLIFK